MDSATGDEQAEHESELALLVERAGVRDVLLRACYRITVIRCCTCDAVLSLINVTSCARVSKAQASAGGAVRWAGLLTVECSSSLGQWQQQRCPHLPSSRQKHRFTVISWFKGGWCCCDCDPPASQMPNGQQRHVILHCRESSLVPVSRALFIKTVYVVPTNLYLLT